MVELIHRHTHIVLSIADMESHINNIGNVVCKVFSHDRLAKAVMRFAFPQSCGMHVPR